MQQSLVCGCSARQYVDLRLYLGFCSLLLTSLLRCLFEPSALAHRRLDVLATRPKLVNLALLIVRDATTGAVFVARFHCFVQIFVGSLILAN